MPKLSGLTKQHPVSVTFGYEDESLTVIFDRNKITRNWMRSITSAVDEGTVDEAIYAATVEIIISWDVVDDAGNPLPPSIEILSQLPIAAFEKLSEAIGNASVPSDAEGKASSELSSASPPAASSDSIKQQPESQPMPQNGQEPSPLPAPSASPSLT